MHYACLRCGYVYDPAKGDPENGVPEGTKGCDLPKEWVCPGCRSSQDDFAGMEEDD